MGTSVGLKLVTSSILDGFDSYKQHIFTPNIKRGNNMLVQMAPYIILHVIIQSYARVSNMVGSTLS
jgi:hypothetical protein